MTGVDRRARCEWCGRDLPTQQGSGRRRRYCDATCRSAARRARARGEKSNASNSVSRSLTDDDRQDMIDVMMTEQAAVLDQAPALEAVDLARRLADGAEANVRRMVDRARQDRSTWQQIGAVLGITRQSAFQRFGHAVDPRTGKLAEPPDQRAVESALAFVNELAAGQWESAAMRFDETVGAKLTPPALAATWAQVIGMCGALEEIGKPYAVRAGDITIVTTPLRFEAAEQQARISYDRDLRIAGLFFHSAEAER